MIPQTDYFKVEGLTATNGHLLLGIREVGLNYEAFSYTITVVNAIIDTDGLKLIGQPQLLKTILSTSKAGGSQVLRLDIGPICFLFWCQKMFDKLTDLNGRLLVTTTAPGADYHYVRSPQGNPLRFHRKRRVSLLTMGSAT